MIALKWIRFAGFMVVLSGWLLLGSCTNPAAIQQPPGALAIHYRLHKPGHVSLAVYDKDGVPIRTLRHAEEQAAGGHVIAWDARDDAGDAVAPGDYTWKMLSTPGFTAEYITSPGSNYAVDNDGPYWAQSPGCHGGPMAIAVDSAGFYVGAFSENIETTVLKQSLDGGKRLWSMRAPDAWTGPTAMGVANHALWAYSPNTCKVYRYDLATGTLGTLGIPGAPGNPPFITKLKDEAPSDMAINDAYVILCYPKQGLVRWLDYKATQVRTVNVPGAAAVDVAPDGTVYAIVSTAMLKIPVGATAAQPFITGLTAPLRAAINPTNGDIYVVEKEPSNQIKRFSSGGVLQQTYGVNGGRTDGLYQTQRGSFRGVADIAVDASGGFWVAEGAAAPRRVAHFTVNGEWVAEWYGGQTWATWIVAEPDNPRFAWMASQWGDMMRVELDFASKTWKVHSCYHYEGMADGLVRGHDNGVVWEVRVHDGTLYLLRVGYPSVIKVDRVNWKLIPASVAVQAVQFSPGLPRWVKNKAGSSQSMLWTDINGDGKALNPDGSIQAGECRYFPAGAPWPGGTINPDAGFNYLFHNAANANNIARFTAGSWTPCGSPVYTTFPGVEIIADAPARMKPNYDGRWSSFLTTDSQGRVWGAFNPNMTDWGTSTDSFIARWNADGKVAWMVGKKGTTPGTFKTLRRVYGVINNCIVVSPFSLEWVADGVTPVYVYNEDGLYAGQLLERPADTTTPSWRYSLGGESLAGTINKDAAGNVYFFGHWINEARVYKITGWNDWATAHGTAKVPVGNVAPPFIPEAIGPDGHGTGLTGRYYTSLDWTGTPVITRVDATLDYEWNPFGKAAGSPIQGTPFYSVRWTGSITPRRTGWHMFRQARGGSPRCDYKVNGISFANPEMPGRAIWLKAGQPYPIEIKYTNYYQHPSITNGVLLQWAEPECNGNFVTIPASQFTPEESLRK